MPTVMAAQELIFSHTKLLKCLLDFDEGAGSDMARVIEGDCCLLVCRIALYCIVLCCHLLYCILLYYIALYCIILHSLALYCIVSYCIV